jgi:hypothetical protein
MSTPASPLSAPRRRQPVGRLGTGMRREVWTVMEGGSSAYLDALIEVVIALMVESGRGCIRGSSSPMSRWRVLAAREITATYQDVCKFAFTASTIIEGHQ